MRLSLHKGGNRPDYRGDKGIHFCTYALLPHLGSMDAENVIRPAYLLNEKPIIVSGHVPLESLLSIRCAQCHCGDCEACGGCWELLCGAAV